MGFSWDGPSLEDVLSDVKRETRRAAREMAHDVSDQWRDVTRRNTPIERFMKPTRTQVPHHLRESWELADVKVVRIPGAEDAYEAGIYTEVEYAPYVEEGTGLWGPEHRKYVIRPKKPGGWLSWIARSDYVRRDGTRVMMGQRVFAKEVMHPGSPGAHMIAIGAHMVEAEFRQVVEPALKRWADRVEAL